LTVQELGRCRRRRARQLRALRSAKQGLVDRQHPDAARAVQRPRLCKPRSAVALRLVRD
jgi:hypothetical protein